MIDKRLRPLRAGHDYNLRNSFFPASQRTAKLSFNQGARCFQMIHDSLARAQRVMDMNSLFSLLASCVDRFQNPLFRLCAKAFELAQLPCLGRGFQFFDRGNSQRLMQQIDLLHVKAAHVRQLDDARRKLRAQLV